MGNTEEKQIYFVNDLSEGYVEKRASSRSTDRNILHLHYFKDVETVSEIIADLDKALSGNFDLIDDPDLTASIYVASITPTEVVFYDDDVENIIETSSLEDFKESAVAWKEFLQTPPFHGSRANLLKWFWYWLWDRGNR
jgi:hypothetical protein